MNTGKWLYRIEHPNSTGGLWYNGHGEYVYNIGELTDCPSKHYPMGYDPRYQQQGKSWFSSCSRLVDLTHWFSPLNVKELVEKGFIISKYLAKDYVEYEKETIFLKETVLKHTTLTIDELFHREGK